MQYRVTLTTRKYFKTGLFGTGIWLSNLLVCVIMVLDVCK